MAELLTALIEQGGPVMWVAFFVFSIFLTWGYNSLLREVAIRQNRIALLLVEKNVATMRELREFGILTDVGSAMSVMEGLV